MLSVHFAVVICDVGDKQLVLC